MRVLGLTGGIASGKSTAAAQLKELGVIVLDADRYGHRVYEPDSPGFHAVVNEFGHDIVGADGEIDRRILGGKVFGAPEKMDRLTDIVWPEIRRIAAEEIAELRGARAGDGDHARGGGDDRGRLAEISATRSGSSPRNRKP